ncbi:MAG: hypothetical protein IT555_05960, partial [Acetobacteraceae bacterium]|nr:hypothetical protein [Acetobacteraceae bacterium]
MATRTPVADRLTEFSLQVVWSGLLLNDNGAAYERPEFQDRTFQVTGTFGGATIALQGSNDNTTWFGLTNSTGAALSYTAAGGGAAREGTRYVRPVVTGGDGTTSLVVTAVMVSRTAARGNVISDPLKLDVAGGTLTGPLLVASGVNIATLQGGATGEPVVV